MSIIARSNQCSPVMHPIEFLKLLLSHMCCIPLSALISNNEISVPSRSTAYSEMSLFSRRVKFSRPTPFLATVPAMKVGSTDTTCCDSENCKCAEQLFTLVETIVPFIMGRHCVSYFVEQTVVFMNSWISTVTNSGTCFKTG